MRSRAWTWAAPITECLAHFFPCRFELGLGQLAVAIRIHPLEPFGFGTLPARGNFLLRQSAILVRIQGLEPFLLTGLHLFTIRSTQLFAGELAVAVLVHGVELFGGQIAAPALQLGEIDVAVAVRVQGRTLGSAFRGACKGADGQDAGDAGSQGSF